MVEETNIPAGTNNPIVDSTIYGRYLVYFSQRSNSNSSNGSTQTFQKGGDSVNPNQLLFLKNVWDSGGAKNGTEIGDVSGDPTNQGDITLPAGSYVSNIQGPLLFGNQSTTGVEYFKVTFNNAFNGTVSPGDLINFTVPATTLRTAGRNSIFIYCTAR